MIICKILFQKISSTEQRHYKNSAINDEYLNPKQLDIFRLSCALRRTYIESVSGPIAKP